MIKDIQLDSEGDILVYSLVEREQVLDVLDNYPNGRSLSENKEMCLIWYILGNIADGILTIPEEEFNRLVEEGRRLWALLILCLI